MRLTDDERETLAEATVDDSRLVRAVERERLARAWDEGALRAAPELAANGSEWLKRNNPYGSGLEACAQFGEHAVSGHAQMVRESSETAPL